MKGSYDGATLSFTYTAMTGLPGSNWFGVSKLITLLLT